MLQKRAANTAVTEIGNYFSYSEASWAELLAMQTAEATGTLLQTSHGGQKQRPIFHSSLENNNGLVGRWAVVEDDAAKIWAEVSGINDGPCVQVLRDWRAATG